MSCIMISRQLFYINNLIKTHLTKSLTSYALIYNEYGDPNNVVKRVDVSDKISKPLSSNEILLKYLASPINPADINTIQGVYAVKPQLPTIGGNEGVAEVMTIGSGVKSVAVGDWVIPTLPASGTWTNHAILKDDDVMVIDKTIDVLSAAQIKVNPCTAYRMLKDFVELKSGDSIIQNGANSAVGIYAIQLAKQWNVKTINVIRNRPDLDVLKSRLKSLGADYVITEEDLRQNDVMKNIFKDIPKPKLALNCVGGKNATDCMRHLDFRGVMVTYGGMSKQPLIIPASSLIFKDQKFYGYWMTNWDREYGKTEEKSHMFKYLCDLYKSGKLETPKCVEMSLDDYKNAIENAMKGFSDVKYVFRMK